MIWYGTGTKLKEKVSWEDLLVYLIVLEADYAIWFWQKSVIFYQE